MHRASALQLVAIATIGVAVLALIGAVALAPASAVVVTVLIGGAAATLGIAEVQSGMPRHELLRGREPVLVGAALAVPVVGLALVRWPVTVALVAVVAAVLALARWNASLALGVGVLLLGFEGSIKLLLGLEDTPIPGGNRAVGATAIDIALFGALAAVLVADRLRTPRALWAAASRLERLALGALGVWLA